jgi:hypothetical protein
MDKVAFPRKEEQLTTYLCTAMGAEMAMLLLILPLYSYMEWYSGREKKKCDEIYPHEIT